MDLDAIWASDTWQWWLEHGFDGIAGGLLGGALGGLVAWWAVRRTITHERELATAAQERSEVAELRKLVLALQASSFTAAALAKGPERDDAEVDTFKALIAAEAQSHSLAPALQRDLTSFRNSIFTSSPERRTSTAFTALSSRAAVWVQAPDKYASYPAMDWVARSRALDRADLTDDPPATESPEDPEGPRR